MIYQSPIATLQSMEEQEEEELNGKIDELLDFLDK